MRRQIRLAPPVPLDQALGRHDLATKVTITIEIPGGANAIVLAPRSRLHSGGSPTAPDPGAIAQLGERLTGSQEVSGSIPLGSTEGRQSRPSVPLWLGYASGSPCRPELLRVRVSYSPPCLWPVGLATRIELTDRGRPPGRFSFSPPCLARAPCHSRRPDRQLAPARPVILGRALGGRS